MTSKGKREKSKGKNFSCRVTDWFPAWLWLKPFLIFAFCLLPFDFVWAQSPTRLAILEFSGEQGKEIAAALREAVKAANGFELLDEDLVRAAATGAGYSGSVNLNLEEARALGQSIGVEFYALGKTLVTRRVVAVSNEQFYFEALAGVFWVETRTGKLILFSFESAKAATEAEAKERIRTILKQSWPRYASALNAAKASHQTAVENLQPLPPTIEVLTDDLTAAGVEQPFFYQRIKPDYSEQADLANVIATVELEVVFRDDGSIGDVEIVKWAGFGLDESAVATVKKLRFKPAERGGKKLTLKGLVRYNFRRPQTQAEKQEETERLKRSLQDIKKPPTQTPRPRPE